MTASKWNDETGLHISRDIVTQRSNPLRNIILEKMGEVMPMPRVTDEAPDETSPRREFTPAPRTIMEWYGMSKVDTEEAGKQRIAVIIAEMYACGHSGTKSTIGCWSIWDGRASIFERNHG